MTFSSWFGFTMAVCVAASTLLLLLLVSSFQQRALHTGSRILLTHLMFIQLLISAVIYPLQTVFIYQTMTPRTVSNKVWE